jgi:hypothetical protein
MADKQVLIISGNRNERNIPGTWTAEASGHTPFSLLFATTAAYFL